MLAQLHAVQRSHNLGLGFSDPRRRDWASFFHLSCPFSKLRELKPETQKSYSPHIYEIVEKSHNNTLKDNLIPRAVTTLWESLTKCQITIPFIMNSSDKLPHYSLTSSASDVGVGLGFRTHNNQLNVFGKSIYKHLYPEFLHSTNLEYIWKQGG
jgi:hypothetical protein